VNSIDIAGVLDAGLDCLHGALAWDEIQQSTLCMSNLIGFETRLGHSTFFEIGRATIYATREFVPQSAVDRFRSICPFQR